MAGFFCNLTIFSEMVGFFYGKNSSKIQIFNVVIKLSFFATKDNGMKLEVDQIKQVV
ncbi:hypothetical protein [Acetobacterium carbinolicum]|uniref:hypothetical protein n=1 Tax=Acetobacterium carbinolicum TaxID=52690 RepID=UPI0039C94A63